MPLWSTRSTRRSDLGVERSNVMRTIEAVRRSAVGIGPERTIREAAGIMDQAGVGALAVIDRDDLVGIDRPRPRAPRPRPRPARRRQGRCGYDGTGRYRRCRRRSTRRVRPLQNARGSPTRTCSCRPVRWHDHHRRPSDRPCRRPVRPRPARDRRSDLRSPRPPVAGHDQHWAVLEGAETAVPRVLSVG